ncbi:MAG: hypothetical protein WC678_03440 [Parcubacteria group bacterium]|jgi:hypothetical protein
MDNKKIKIISVIIIIIAVFFSVVVFFFNKPKSTTVPNQEVSQQKQTPEDIKKAEEERVQAEIRKKIETEDVELSVRGKISFFDKKIVKFTELNGEELELNIPQKGVIVFLKKNGDTENLLGNYSLENISKNQEVSVVYMTLSKKLLRVVIE